MTSDHSLNNVMRIIYFYSFTLIYNFVFVFFGCCSPHEIIVSYLAPTVWNELPLDTRLSLTIDTFKRRLKTHLFTYSTSAAHLATAGAFDSVLLLTFTHLTNCYIIIIIIIIVVHWSLQYLCLWIGCDW